jgi:hypothetical protein
MVAPDLRHPRRSQAEIPLIDLSEFGQPPLNALSESAREMVTVVMAKFSMLATSGYQASYPKSGSWMIACVGRIGRTVGDGPIAAGAFASPYG